MTWALTELLGIPELTGAVVTEFRKAFHDVADFRAIGLDLPVRLF